MLRFYRQSKLIWLTLIALCLLWLLPLIYAAQQAQTPSTAVQASLCSSIKSIKAPAVKKTETPAEPTAHIQHCPICINSSQHDWLPSMAPAVLPSIQYDTRLLRLVGNEGFFISAPSYTLPQSQAPPIA